MHNNFMDRMIAVINDMRKKFTYGWYSVGRNGNFFNLTKFYLSYMSGRETHTGGTYTHTCKETLIFIHLYTYIIIEQSVLFEITRFYLFFRRTFGRLTTILFFFETLSV